MIKFPHLGKARSIVTGFKRKCPSCEKARVFASYLKLKDKCPHCGAPIGEIRADDFPAYLTIFIVGHITVPGLFVSEMLYHPPTIFQMIFWPSTAILLALLLLPRLKGAVVGFMWSLGMKGDEFGG